MSWPERCKCHTNRCRLSVSYTKMSWWRLDRSGAVCVTRLLRRRVDSELRLCWTPFSAWTAPFPRVPRCARRGNPLLRSGLHTHHPRQPSRNATVMIWSLWNAEKLIWSSRVTMFLAELEERRFGFCTEIQAARVGAAAAVVLIQCKSARDSCSLHSLQVYCCFTHHHRGSHHWLPTRATIIRHQCKSRTGMSTNEFLLYVEQAS